MRIIRNIIALYLAVNILLGTLMVPLIHLDFKMRRDYIAKILCIKRDRPITVCGGKCYLADQLKKASDSSEKESKMVNRSAQISFAFHEIPVVSFSNRYLLHDYSFNRKPVLGAPNTIVHDIFKPPRLT
ncbi:MAG: hypothetical protein AAGG59_16005 [Bacteroidota bacterium]